MVSWLYEYGNYRRFTHTVLLQLPSEIDRSSIELMLQMLLDGHDTLRSILADTPDGPRLVTREPGVVSAADLLTRVELPNSTDAELDAAITHFARRVTDEIDPYTGAMVRAVWFSGPERGEVLLITAHHLAVDVVSWHIMLGDIAEAWRSVKSGGEPQTLPEFTSYRRWSELMWERAATPEVGAQRDYWIAQVRDPDPALGVRHPDPTRDTWSTLRVTPVLLQLQDTERVLAALTRDGGVREFLLAATTIAVASWRACACTGCGFGHADRPGGPWARGRRSGHRHHEHCGLVHYCIPGTARGGCGGSRYRAGRGRPGVGPRPARLGDCPSRWIPNEGLDYGLLRYVDRVPELQQAAEPQIQFSYLGRLDLSGATDQPWSLLTAPHLDALPIDPEPDLPLRFALHVSVLVGATPAGHATDHQLALERCPVRAVRY